MFLSRVRIQPAFICRRNYSGVSAQLGVRAHHPVDGNPQKENNNGDNEEVSDQDWEIRTGRAIYVLQQTLPDFFSTGLVTAVDKATGSPCLTLAPDSTTETIYSPKVRLAYTPPTALPPPFPTTLHVEGLPLYLASSVFARHTLNALYTDLHVVLRRVIVKTPPRPITSNATSTPSGSSIKQRRFTSLRDKSLLIGLTVAGTGRVSKSPGEWEVTSTYTFSPKTGLILAHTINSIHPAPHQAVYDALRLSFANVFGLGLEGSGSTGGTTTNGAACHPVPIPVRLPDRGAARDCDVADAERSGSGKRENEG